MATNQNNKTKFGFRDWHSLWQVHGGLTCLASQESFLAMSHLFLTYKCTRKQLLENLFVVDIIFSGRLRPEDIQYYLHENWKLLEVKTVEVSASTFDCMSDNIFRYHFPLLQCIILTNILSSVKVSLVKNWKIAIWKKALILEKNLMIIYQRHI